MPTWCLEVVGKVLREPLDGVPLCVDIVAGQVDPEVSGLSWATFFIMCRLMNPYCVYSRALPNIAILSGYQPVSSSNWSTYPFGLLGVAMGGG